MRHRAAGVSSPGGHALSSCSLDPYNGPSREHPLYLTVLSMVPPERRRVVLVRGILLAYVVPLAFLFLGDYVMQFLGLDQATISVSGGIVLFLIAIRMIFPGELAAVEDPPLGEPFLVPLAIPLFAGPSVLATLLLLQRPAPWKHADPGCSTDDRLGCERRHSACIHVLLSNTRRARPYRDGAIDGYVARYGCGADVHEWSQTFLNTPVSTAPLKLHVPRRCKCVTRGGSEFWCIPITRSRSCWSATVNRSRWRQDSCIRAADG